MLVEVEAWLRFIGHWALLPISIIGVFEGTRALVQKRATRAHIALGIGTLCVLVGISASTAWIAYKTDAVAVVYGTHKLPDSPEGAFSDRSPEERAQLTRLVALFKFNEAGVLTSHLTRDGDTVTFAPTEEEIRRRENIQKGMAEAKVGLSMLKTKAWIFAISTVVAIILGALSTPMFRSKR